MNNPIEQMLGAEFKTLDHAIYHFESIANRAPNKQEMMLLKTRVWRYQRAAKSDLAYPVTIDATPATEAIKTIQESLESIQRSIETLEKWRANGFGIKASK